MPWLQVFCRYFSGKLREGTYKPHMRVYDFSEMSMKFERHTSAENIQFLLLSDDWTKSVHLQNDRSIEFHNQGGLQYSTRIPRMGRDLAYHYPSCDLYIAAAGEEVYRLNLEQGRFLNSLEVESAGNGVNCIDICSAHQLVGFGTEAGTVEFWDPRIRSRAGILEISSAERDDDGVTALAYRMDGLNLAVGTKSGQTLLYDLRSPRPYLRKNQGYDLPIKNLSWLESRHGSENAKVLSADKKIIKIWSAVDGGPYTSIEPPLDINDVCPVPDTGLIFVANEGTPMHTYYIPQLGPAPRWCSFLDNLTEEMEHNPTQSTYDNYKFVTRKELAALSLDKLVGTNVVKSYMHGYFIDVRLFEQAKLIANPFAYEEYRDKKIKEKIEKERESRIRTSAAQHVKVNKSLAARLEERDRLADKKGKKTKEVFLRSYAVLTCRISNLRRYWMMIDSGMLLPIPNLKLMKILWSIYS
jgi:ribosome biogenesis protein ENP2